MTFFALMMVLFTATNVISSAQVGVIYNVSLTMFPSSMTSTNASSCEECLCAMLNLTGNSSTLSLNCYINNSHYVICELFSTATYLSSYSYKMENNSNSTFYFQQLPSSIQPESTTATIVATSEVPAITSAVPRTTETPSVTTPYPYPSLRWNSTGTTLAANGSASNQVYSANTVFIVAGSDVLYIADSGNNRIQKWLPGANSATTVAGGQGKGTNATQLNNPIVLCVDENENMFVADRGNYRVQFFANGSLFGRTIIRNGTTSTPNNLIGNLFGIGIDLASNVYVSEYNFNRILKLQPNATNATLAAGNGTAGNSPYQINDPTGFYVDPSTGTLYIASQAAHCIVKWSPGASSGTTVAGTCGTSGSNATLFNTPRWVTFDKYGNMYVADGTGNSSRVTMFYPNSMIGIPIVTSDLNSPHSIALDTNLRMYVTDMGNNRIAKYELL